MALLLLPASVFVLVWLLVARYRSLLGVGELSVRGCLLVAFLAFELIVLAITYGLSLFAQFTHGMVIVSWTVVLAALVWTARKPLRAELSLLYDRPGFPAPFRRRWRMLEVEDRIWIGVLALIVLVIAFVGFRYPPSNSDSMAYHLVRIEVWIQNRSVAPFATHYLPQVEFGPLAEFNIAHIRIMTGTDRADVLVELLSMVICVLGASEVARLLGGGRRVQIGAAVICATIPSGVLLASSTENNYFSATCAVAILALGLTFSFRQAFLKKSLALGVAAGVAYLAKATIPIVVLPAVAVFVVHALVRDRAAWWSARGAWRITRGAAGFVLAGALVVLPFAAQIEHLDGEFFGGPASTAATSSPWSIDVGLGNVVRNVANEFHVGNGRAGPGYELSSSVLPVLARAFDALHVPPNDPRFDVSPGISPFSVTNYSYAERTEEAAADPLDLALIVISTAVLCVAVARRSPRSRRALALAGGLGLGYLLFTATAKWGEWDVRYDLPLFVGWSAVIAVALGRWSAWLLRVVLVLVCIACLPQLVDGGTRPLLGQPADQASALTPYFVDCCRYDPADTAKSYESASAVLAQSSCREAFVTNWIEFEYPLWVGLRQEGWTGRLDETDVGNYTSSLETHRRGCASVSQRTVSYTTPDNGDAWWQFGELVVSVRPSDATSVRQHDSTFTSGADGIRVLAGGGWRLIGFDGLPVLDRHGSVYVVSSRATRARLDFVYPPHTDQTPVAATTPDGTRLVAQSHGDTESVDLDLRPGVNRIDLTVSPVTPDQHPFVVLESIGTAGR